MRYTDSHEWIKVEDNIGTVGISSHAQKELGEIVYIELPPIGKKFEKGQEIAVLESTKAAADIYSPVTGEIIAINENATAHINTSPETSGWLFKLKLTHPYQTETLLTPTQYQTLVQ